MAVMLFVLGRFLAPVFLPSAEGQAVASTYWAIAPFAMGGYGVAMAAAAGFNGLGRPLIGVACNAFRGVALIIPLAWLGNYLGGANGVIWGLFAANLIAGVVIAFLVLKFAPLTAKEGGKR